MQKASRVNPYQLHSHRGLRRTPARLGYIVHIRIRDSTCAVKFTQIPHSVQLRPESFQEGDSLTRSHLRGFKKSLLSFLPAHSLLDGDSGKQRMGLTWVWCLSRSLWCHFILRISLAVHWSLWKAQQHPTMAFWAQHGITLEARCCMVSGRRFCCTIFQDLESPE